MQHSLIIKPIAAEFQKEAKDLILNGMKERFGFIDYSLNPDLNYICTAYSKAGHVFFVGFLEDELVCTGALTMEDSNVARVERMSVKQANRRNGLAKVMLTHLEHHAITKGYSKIVLETNQNWDSAIAFYKNNGYHFDFQVEEQVHFKKKLFG